MNTHPAPPNNLQVEQSANGIQLNFGAGSSNNARDAFGTTTSDFGFPGNAFFDGELVKFGNSGNQQLLDFRITNNTGADEAANTGNGAHSTATTNGNNASSGNGGSGIVVIRYAL